MKEKNTLVAQIQCAFQMHNKRLQARSFLVIWVRNYLFLKRYNTSEGALSHNVLYHQQLTIAYHQVGFYAKNYLSNYRFKCPVPLIIRIAQKPLVHNLHSSCPKVHLHDDMCRIMSHRDKCKTGQQTGSSPEEDLWQSLMRSNKVMSYSRHRQT